MKNEIASTPSADSSISTRLLALVAVWAFAESSFWFVAVDFLLVPFSILFPRHWLKTAGVAWIASHCGGALYFLFCRSNIELAGTILGVTPFVSQRMHDFISNLYTDYGAWGAIAQSWSFMSFKIWTYEAVKHGLAFFSFFSIVMFSRVFRLFVVAWFAARLSPVFLPIWTKGKIWSWVIYTIGFLGMLIVIEK
jgi:hypothetical protein